MSPTNPPNPAQQTKPTGDRREELERIKAATWPPDEPAEVRAERIARNLAAFDARPKWPPLDAETMKWLAEDPDVSDLQ
jgi:hypothetical protein